jgi:3-hydroxybutyryl-CoA dehydrogenase
LASTDPERHSADLVGVVGGGTMGAGIAQVAALAGHPVRVHDLSADAAAEAVRTAVDGIRRLAKRELVEPGRADAAIARLTAAPALEDLAGSVAVVEAVVEDLAVKRALFEQLERIVGEDTLLATNTSSLSVTALARGMRHPERFVGLHFFNPAARMKLVEVARGAQSGPAFVELATNLVRCWGKTPVRCESTPGFIVNRVARPFYGEAQRLVEDAVADPATIDALMHEGGGFPLGPFELSDLIGQDVNLAVARSVWEQTFHDPRYAPTIWQQRLVDAGWLGRKTGRGVYRYDESRGHGNGPLVLDPGTGTEPAPWTAPRHQAPPYVVDAGGFSVLAGLLPRMAAAGVRVLENAPSDQPGAADDGRAAHRGLRLPSGGRFVETSGVTASGIGGDVVVVDWVLDPDAPGRVAVAVSPDALPATVSQALGLLQAAGLRVSVVEDGPGLVLARTVAMLVNEAADVVYRGEASAADVDTALRLGAGYPLGPLAWGDTIGVGLVLRVLRALHDAVPTGRYRAGRGLTVAAERGLALHG